MPYFHVLLAFQGSENQLRCIFKDLDQRALRKQFLKPYERGQRLLAGSEVIDTMTIASTVIVETKRPDEEERNALYEADKQRQEQMSREGFMVFSARGHGYDPEDILEAGSDVTAEYITTPPGDKNNSLLSAVVNHPWISAIVTGLIVAGSAKALGWV